MLYRYRGIVINVITRNGRVATAVPVSKEAVDMFTLDNGVMYIPNETLKIFKNEDREIRGVNV